MDRLGALEFDWDKGNIDKSFVKHGITPNQSEEIFLDESLLVVRDVQHQQSEDRWIAVGVTFQRQLLFVIFTMRGKKLRVISARKANKKERVSYEQSA